MRITDLAPWSMAYFIVGRAPTMRWGLVTFLSESKGTLKSTCLIGFDQYRWHGRANWSEKVDGELSFHQSKSFG